MKWYEGYMKVEELKELSGFIEQQHASTFNSGKAIRTMIPVIQCVDGEMFVSSICLIGEDEDHCIMHFTIDEETSDYNLKHWIKHWLDFGTWDNTDIPERYINSIKQVLKERPFNPYNSHSHGKEIGCTKLI